MIYRAVATLAVILVTTTCFGDNALAQVYVFESQAYGNANFNTTVVDEVVYEFVGQTRWKANVRVRRASDGAVLRGFEPLGLYDEAYRGGGEVELRPVGQNRDPVKISDNGTSVYRTYPSLPIPEGIDPNEKRWWSNKGSGKWVKGRPQ